MKRTLAGFYVLLPVLFLAPFLTPGAAGEEDRWDPFTTMSPDVVPKLEDLAAWCESRKLLVERVEVLEAILLFASDHAAARRGLGYQRERDGEWSRRTSWRAPTTTRPEHAAEFAARRIAILEPIVNASLAGLHERRETIGPARRDRILGRLVALAPNDEPVRRARGEARLGQRWVLVETVTASRERPALRKAITEIRAAEPAPRRGGTDDVDHAIGLRWVDVYVGESVRVVGTAEEDELRDAVRLGEVTSKIFRRVFAAKTKPLKGYTVHLLDGPREKNTYLDRHPKMTESDRRYARNLDSAWASGGWDVGIWSRERATRKEWVARQTLAGLIRLRFNLDLVHGALWEGLGLYLGFALTGERQTWYVRPAGYGEAAISFQARLRKRTSSWFVLARKLVKEGKAPDYRFLLAKKVNEMDGPDLVHAYVFAAYLVEGRPAGWVEFIHAVGHGTHPATAAQKSLGMSLPELERRVVRWLDERKDSIAIEGK